MIQNQYRLACIGFVAIAFVCCWDARGVQEVGIPGELRLDHAPSTNWSDVNTMAMDVLFGEAATKSLAENITVSWLENDARNTPRPPADVDPHSGHDWCADCGLCECLCCCGPAWYTSAELLFMRRGDSEARPLIFDQITGVELLNAKDMDFDSETGARLRLIRHSPYLTARACACVFWEIGYLGIDSWSTSNTPTPLTSPLLVGPGFALPSTGPGALFRGRYGSDLYSFELNLRREVTDCSTILAGFRWVELSDELVMDEVSVTTIPMYSVDTSNHLYGFQIGGDMVLWNAGGWIHVDTLLRGGLYYNRAEQSTLAPALTPVIPLFVDRITAADSQTSFLGEIGLVGVMEMNDTLSVRAGYQVMWLEGIALAPEQIAGTDLSAPGSATVRAEGGLFYHGGSVGLALKW